ncbi:MAG: nitroreductase family deazaflavin-dependent oxidoreductase [Solirubrobacterales bacterium]
MSRVRRALWNGFVRAHIPAYRLTRGRFLPSPLGRSRTVLVDHVGRRSGIQRTAALLYLADGGDIVVVASKGGSHKHPAWWLNLREMDETEIQIGGERHRMRVRQATPEERRRLWPRVVEIWPDYERYQERTEREIPLGILSPALVSSAD